MTRYETEKEKKEQRIGNALNEDSSKAFS